MLNLAHGGCPGDWYPKTALRGLFCSQCWRSLPLLSVKPNWSSEAGHSPRLALARQPVPRPGASRSNSGIAPDTTTTRCCLQGALPTASGCCYGTTTDDDLPSFIADRRRPASALRHPAVAPPPSVANCRTTDPQSRGLQPSDMFLFYSGDGILAVDSARHIVANKRGGRHQGTLRYTVPGRNRRMGLSGVMQHYPREWGAEHFRHGLDPRSPASPASLPPEGTGSAEQPALLLLTSAPDGNFRDRRAGWGQAGPPQARPLQVSSHIWRRRKD